MLHDIRLNAPPSGDLRGLYIARALERACFEELDNHTVYATIPGLRGVWANAATREAVQAELYEVLDGWPTVRQKRHLAIPAIDGIDLSA